MRFCVVEIQKNIRRFVYRKYFQKRRKATLTLQAAARGFFARQWYKMERLTKAVVTVQKHVRSWKQRKVFAKARKAAITIQTSIIYIPLTISSS